MSDIVLPTNLVSITTSITLNTLTWSTTIAAQTHKLPEIESAIHMAWDQTLSAMRRAQQETAK